MLTIDSLYCLGYINYLSVYWPVEDDCYLCGTSNVEGQCSHREVPGDKRVTNLLTYRSAWRDIIWVIIAISAEAEIIKLLDFEGRIPWEEGHPVLSCAVGLVAGIFCVHNRTVRVVRRRPFGQGPVVTCPPCEVKWDVAFRACVSYKVGKRNTFTSCLYDTKRNYYAWCNICWLLQNT